MLKNVKGWALIGIASLLVAGCSGTVDGGGSGGSGAGGNGSGGMGTGGMGTGGMGTGGMGTGGSGGGSGIACGGFAGVLCPATEYCDFPDDICGAADGQGVCRTRPQACPEIYMPVCACDGKVYSNACDANGGGFDVSNNGGCPPPEATLFNCGHLFCNSATEYCNKTLSDVAGLPDSYGCAPLPAACAGGAPSCMCIGDPCGAPIAGTCAASGTGFMVTCPGG